MSARRHVLCMEISLRLWTNHTAPVLNFSNRRTRLRLLNLSASHLFTRSRSAGFLKKNSIRDNPLLLTSRPKMFTKSKSADARSRKKTQRYFHKMETLGTEQNKNSPHTQIADICHRQNADYRRFFDFFSTRACVLSDSKREKKKKKLTKAYRGSFWYRVPTRVQLKACSSLMRGALNAFSLGTTRKKLG